MPNDHLYEVLTDEPVERPAWLDSCYVPDFGADQNAIMRLSLEVPIQDMDLLRRAAESIPPPHEGLDTHLPFIPGSAVLRLLITNNGNPPLDSLGLELLSYEDPVEVFLPSSAQADLMVLLDVRFRILDPHKLTVFAMDSYAETSGLPGPGEQPWYPESVGEALEETVLWSNRGPATANLGLEINQHGFSITREYIGV
jgi:hypothetical protein